MSESNADARWRLAKDASRLKNENIRLRTANAALIKAAEEASGWLNADSRLRKDSPRIAKSALEQAGQLDTAVAQAKEGGSGE